jgi:hypothetical protein
MSSWSRQVANKQACMMIYPHFDSIYALLLCNRILGNLVSLSGDEYQITQIQRLTMQLVLSAPEVDEVKVVLQQMLKELDDRGETMAQNSAKTTQEILDIQAKVTEYETSLVTLSDEADEATQAADSADLRREVWMFGDLR